MKEGQQKKGGKGNTADKPKAKRLPITQLVVISAYEKHFSTGKNGFFGQVQDPMTGKRYQVVGAVELATR